MTLGIYFGEPGLHTCSLSQTLFVEMDSNSSLQMEEKQMFAIQCVLG